MITQDQLKDVLERADALKRYLEIDKKQMEYEEEDLRTQAPDFWEDRKRAEEQMKKVKSIKKWLDGYKEVRTLADELQLPVVPLTINGSFNVLPRMKDWHFISWHPLRLTIHQPIYPVGQGSENVEATLRQAYDSVMSALVPEYQGYVDNPDQ